MKKVLIAVVLGAVLLVNTAFANNETNKNETVSQKVETAFYAEFGHATNVSWQKTDNYYKAIFKLNDAVVTSYFTSDGQLLGIVHNILSTQLPINLQSNLKNDYDNYWISDLFEYSKQDDNGYYISLENADQTIVLHSSNGSSWSVFRKVKKQ